MEKIIVFDSDFIIANKKKISNILDDFKDYECYISDVSVKEVSYINAIEKLDIIENIQSKISYYEKLGIVFNKNNEKMKNQIISMTSSYLENIFKKKIVPYNSHDLDILMSRAFNKIPPFGKSDKGFKDSVIILDLINFIKLNDVKQLYLVTNDSDFINNNKIEEEIKTETKCNFKIIDGKNIDKLYNYFNIGNSKKIEELSESLGKDIDIDIRQFRDDLKNICFDMFHYSEYIPYQGEYTYNNFKVHEGFSKKQILDFLKKLDENINNNIFNSTLTISNFFDDQTRFYDEIDINIEIFEKLNNIYLKIQDNNKYVDSLVNLLQYKFNEMYVDPAAEIYDSFLD